MYNKAIIQKHWLEVTVRIGPDTLLVRVVVAARVSGGCSPDEVIDVVLLKQ